MYPSKQLWKENISLSIGTHHSSTNIECPWDSIHEIIPGLFLTCKSRVADKIKAMNDRVVLILNLCAAQHASKYTVFHNDENEELSCLTYNQDDFFIELDKYTSNPLLNTSKKLLFECKISADDLPTYNISQHFMECCYLIELCLCNRRSLELQAMNTSANTILPNVVVHCLVGVSRSSSIVAAYLMKKFHLALEWTLTFIKSVRPVVSPNLGFLQQLEEWGAWKYRIASDEWSAKQVGSEIKESCNLKREWHDYIKELMKKGKLREGRINLSITMECIGVEHGRSLNEQFGFAECFHLFNQFMEDELYADIPDIFQYICEIIASIQRYFLKSSYYLEKNEWSDSAFIPFLCSLVYHSNWRDLNEIGSSQGDAIQSFLVSIHRIHSHGKSPFLLSGSTTYFKSSAVSPPLLSPNGELKNFVFSFPILPLVVPIAMIEIAILNLSANTTAEEARDDRVIADESDFTKEKRCEKEGGKRLYFSEASRGAFHQLWREASEFLISLFDPHLSSPLNFFKEDVELTIFQYLHERLIRECSTIDFTPFDQMVLSVYTTVVLNNSHILQGCEEICKAVLEQKVYGAILAFRLLLEVCEEHNATWESSVSEKGRPSHERRVSTASFSCPLADEVLDWCTVSILFERVHSIIDMRGEERFLGGYVWNRRPGVPASFIRLSESSKQIFQALQKKNWERDSPSSRECVSWKELLSSNTDD